MYVCDCDWKGSELVYQQTPDLKNAQGYCPKCFLAFQGCRMSLQETEKLGIKVIRVQA
jgi:hypothetical protein